MANDENDRGPPLGSMLRHAALAAAFFFLLQRFVLNESVAVSLLWAGFFAVAAAGLAWHQSRRG